MKSAMKAAGQPRYGSVSQVRDQFERNFLQAVRQQKGPFWDSMKAALPSAPAFAAIFSPLLAVAIPVYTAAFISMKPLWKWRGNRYLKVFGMMRRVQGVLFTAPGRMARGLIAGTKGRGAPWSNELAYSVLNQAPLLGLKQAGTLEWVRAYDGALADYSKNVNGSLEAQDAIHRAVNFANDHTDWIEPYFKLIGEALRRGEPIYTIPSDRQIINEMRTGLYAPRTRKRWSEGPAKMYPRGVNNNYYRMVVMYPPGTYATQGKKLLDKVPGTFQGKPVRDVIGVKAYDNLLGAHIYRARGGSWKKIGVVNFETKEQREKRQRAERAKRQAETKTGKRPADALGAEIADASNTTKALMAVVAAKLIGLF